jgi:response regulator of citrate/malate metabolism
MEIQEIINIIKIQKRHGIIKRVSEKTGISQPTVKKYLNGHVISDKALLVLKAALEDVENA